MHKKNLNNILTLISLIKLISFIVGTKGLMGNSKTWTYELKSITSKTSDSEKMSFNLGIARVSRGVYAVSGDFTINIDIVEGDSNNIAVKSYRSLQADSDYKVLPFQISTTHFFKVLSTTYKDVLMDTLKDCSDLPYFEDTFEPPLEKRIYKLDACKFSNDGLPNHLQEGFYKLSIIGTGEVEWQVDIIAEVLSAD